MPTIDALVRDFLAQKRIAVTGVSRTRDDAANIICRKLRRTGYRVYPVNPDAETFDGLPCYADLKPLPESVDGVVIVNRPTIAEQIVGQCLAQGVPRVWMHSAWGTRPPRAAGKLAASMTSVSPEAVKLCRENDIAVIPGGCPMMFCPPVDIGHLCMRWVLRALGAFAS